MSGLSKPVNPVAYRNVQKILAKLSSKDISSLGKLYYQRFDGVFDDFGYLFFKVIENLAIENDKPFELKKAILRKIKKDSPSFRQLLDSLEGQFTTSEIGEIVGYLLAESVIGQTKEGKLVPLK